MLYLILSTNSFRKSAISELESFGRCRIRNTYPNMVLVEADRHFQKAFESGKPIFSYAIFPIMKSLALDGEYLEAMGRCLNSMRIPGLHNLPVKIECMLISSRLPYSAKDIEVYLGTGLEKKGIDVNLTT